MNSYDKINRDYVFEVNRGLGYQHLKILSEIQEVKDEVVYLPEGEELYFKTTLSNYVCELLDVMMACNNQLVRMEEKYGEHFMKRTTKYWDDKMKQYKEIKYNVTD